METFTIKQEVSLLEFIYMLLTSLSRLKMIQTIFIFTILAGVISNLNNILSYKGFVHFLYYPIALSVFFIFFIVIFATYLMNLKPYNYKNVIYYFNDSGMLKRGNGFEISRAWTGFIKYTLTKNYILLYISENDAHIIQKRMFENSIDLENFIKLLNSKIMSK